MKFLLIAAASLLFSAQGAVAQTHPSIEHDSETGAVQVDRNAFDLSTGRLQNDSKIPLPAGLIHPGNEGEAQPVRGDSWAPNTVELSPDLDYINRTFNQLLEASRRSELSYELDPEN